VIDMKTEEDEAFEELAKRQGDWGMQGSRKHQILRYVQDQERNDVVPNTIAFHSNNVDWVMRITADRRIEVNKGVEVTEAAQKVLDAMQGMLDVGLERAVLAEREACANLVEGLPAPSVYSDTDVSMWDVTCMDCATAIRLRGEQA
jgi:hypothetical protein